MTRSTPSRNRIFGAMDEALRAARHLRHVCREAPCPDSLRGSLLWSTLLEGWQPCQLARTNLTAITERGCEVAMPDVGELTVMPGDRPKTARPVQPIVGIR